LKASKRFTVVIPSFNAERHLRATIDSVLSQTFADYETIVIDDGSGDGTPEIIKSYGKRISPLFQKNQGPEAARDAGVAAATGEYIAFLDHDDLFLPWTLSIYDRIIREFDSPPVILGSMVSGNISQEPIQNEMSSHAITVFRFRDFLSRDIGLSFSHSKMVIRKPLLEQINESEVTPIRAFPFEDYDRLLRMGTCGPCIIVEKPNTVLHRKHDTNFTRNIEFMCNGFFSLINSERKGKYPGGSTRRFARYACLGGPAVEWIKKARRSRLPWLALKILLKSWPMIAAAVIRKSMVRFNPARPLVLTGE
jgi:glycosyltransferase involved in cell wall biosynthesis